MENQIWCIIISTAKDFSVISNYLDATWAALVLSLMTQKTSMCTLWARFGSCAQEQKARPALRHLIIALQAGNETKSVCVRTRMKLRLCNRRGVVLVYQKSLNHWVCEKKFREVP